MIESRYSTLKLLVPGRLPVNITQLSILLVIFCVFGNPQVALSQQYSQPDSGLPQLSVEQIDWIGKKIFNNECSLKIPCLTSWNEGEDFPSLGLGHFIWFREGQSEPFVESFPELIKYFRENTVGIPLPIENLVFGTSPWQTREQFYQQFHLSQLMALREFLSDTMPYQTSFIIQRLHLSLPKLLQETPHQQREAIESLFYQLAASVSNANGRPFGMYALIDYVNFKGEGTSPSERYKGKGWGLLQVLEEMLYDPDMPVMQNFNLSAKSVLARRVVNSPHDRNESRWTAGWNKRIDSYTPQLP